MKSPCFQNMVMDKLVKLCEHVYREFRVLEGTSVEQITYVFTQYSENSPLRKLVLDFLLSCVDLDTWLEGCGGSKLLHDSSLGFCQEFLKLCVRVAHARETMGKPWNLEPCWYHQHPDKPKGYRCSRRPWDYESN